jgi:hypothetical protein
VTDERAYLADLFPARWRGAAYGGLRVHRLAPFGRAWPVGWLERWCGVTFFLRRDDFPHRDDRYIPGES